MGKKPEAQLLETLREQFKNPDTSAKDRMAVLKMMTKVVGLLSKQPRRVRSDSKRKAEDSPFA